MFLPDNRGKNGLEGEAVDFESKHYIYALHFYLLLSVFLIFLFYVSTNEIGFSRTVFRY